LSAAIDTEVLVRVIVRAPTAATQCAAAKCVVAEASASGEPLLITLRALLETKGVLRSRYKFDRASMTAAVIAMLETPGIEFEQAPTVEEALYLFKQVPPADFEDCLLVARATRLGRDRFLIFDAGAAKLPRAEWVQRFRKGAHRGGHGAGAMPICSRRPVPGGEFTHSTGRFASLAAGEQSRAMVSCSPSCRHAAKRFGFGLPHRLCLVAPRPAARSKITSTYRSTLKRKVPRKLMCEK